MDTRHIIISISLCIMLTVALDSPESNDQVIPEATADYVKDQVQTDGRKDSSLIRLLQWAGFDTLGKIAKTVGNTAVGAFAPGVRPFKDDAIDSVAKSHAEGGWKQVFTDGLSSASDLTPTGKNMMEMATGGNCPKEGDDCDPKKPISTCLLDGTLCESGKVKKSEGPMFLANTFDNILMAFSEGASAATMLGRIEKGIAAATESEAKATKMKELLVKEGKHPEEVKKLDTTIETIREKEQELKGYQAFMKKHPNLEKIDVNKLKIADNEKEDLVKNAKTFLKNYKKKKPKDLKITESPKQVATILKEIVDEGGSKSEKQAYKVLEALKKDPELQGNTMRSLRMNYESQWKAITKLAKAGADNHSTIPQASTKGFSEAANIIAAHFLKDH